MRATRALILTCLGVSALSAIVADGAQASEGPFFKIQGVGRLTTGSAAISVKQFSGQAFEASTIGKVICPTVKAATGSVIEGTTSKNSGKGKVTLEYSGCTVEENTAGCAVENGSFSTKPLRLLLGYGAKAGTEGTGKLLTLFRPEGNEFAEIKTTGTCTPSNFRIENKASCTPLCEGVIAQNLNGAEEPVEVGRNETEATKNLLRFPPAAEEITTIFTEAGSLTERKSGLSSRSSQVKYKGFLELTLASGKTWGVFS